jgi:hypothetical protein
MLVSDLSPKSHEKRIWRHGTVAHGTPGLAAGRSQCFRIAVGVRAALAKQLRVTTGSMLAMISSQAKLPLYNVVLLTLVS